MNKHSNIAAAGLCAGLFVFSSLTASAEWTLSYDGTRWQLKDGTWTLNVERDDDARTLTITKYVGGTGALDLTAVEHDTQGYKVVAIADATRARDSSFWGLNGITSLCAPDLVKIGDNAFRGCSTLKTIDADTLANVETIGVEAFHVDSGGLEGDLVLPRVTALPDLCFQSCKNITSISAPRVVSVGYRALYYCEALENVVICGGGAIGNDSFRGIKEGANVRFKGDAPASIGTFAFVPIHDGAGLPYIVVRVEHSRYLGNWEGLYAALTAGDRGRFDFPGKRTMGRVKNGTATAMAWLVNGDYSSQTIFMVQ